MNPQRYSPAGARTTTGGCSGEGGSGESGTSPQHHYPALAQIYYRTQERTRKEKIVLAGCGKASNFGELTATLKRCPDTKLEFSSVCRMLEAQNWRNALGHRS